MSILGSSRKPFIIYPESARCDGECLSYLTSGSFSNNTQTLYSKGNLKCVLVRGESTWSDHWAFHTKKKKKPFHLQNIKQGKGYMKTYWLKGKKDLSFKTPAELRYSSEQKDSEDKSSNEWVDERIRAAVDSHCPLLIQSGLCSLFLATRLQSGTNVEVLF